MALDIKSWVYTSRSGHQYVTGIASYVGAQESPPGTSIVGGAAYTGTPQLDAMPQSLVPRHVVCINPTTGKRRSVVCMTETAALYAGTVTTLQLHDGNGVTATYNAYSPQGEKARRRAAGQ